MVKRKALASSLLVETKLFFRYFSGPFFAFVFPLVMLVLYGSIYGNEPTPFFGGRGAMDVSVPAYSAMVISVTGLMTLPLSIAEYTDLKIYKRYDATPAGKGMVLLAQMLVNLVMAVMGILLLIAAGKLLYNIKITGNMGLVFGAVVLSILCLFSLGFMLTALSPDRKVTTILCNTLYFVMLFASGATLPSEMFPEKVAVFSKFLPLTHVVILLKETMNGAEFAAYRQSLLVLAGCTLVFIGTGWFFYRRKRWNQ